MWNIKTKVIPKIIVGTTGTVSKSFRKHPSDIPGKHINEVQTTAILDMANTPR
jgi:hypothetical protein